MLKERIKETVQRQHDFFGTGATLGYKYRLNKLNKLKTAIQTYEKRIMQALRDDLGKGDFESYATEISIVYTEINHAVRHLKKWMKPKRVGTPIVSFGGVSKIHKQPLGVVLIMTPWNYPFMLSLAPVLAAIAAGNCVVLKPSSYSPNTSAVIENMVSEFFKDDYFSVFQGNREINQILLEQKFDYIFFTGSQKVGKLVMKAASENLTPITLELGGKSPCIVDENVDIKKTAKRIVWGKSINVGQTCIAPDYVLVHKDVKDKLVDEMIKAKEKFFGENMLESKDYGKIVRPQAFAALVKLMEGQRILHGGKHDEKAQKIELTFLDNPKLDSDVMSREIFGPVLPIISVDNMEQARSIIKKYSKPLALYVFTKNKEFERYMVENIQFGGGCINDTIMHITNGNLPFGGIGDSGMGSYHGDESFETFSHTKSILRQNFAFDIPIRYAPYKKKLGLVKKLVK